VGRQVVQQVCRHVWNLVVTHSGVKVDVSRVVTGDTHGIAYGAAPGVPHVLQQLVSPVFAPVLALVVCKLTHIVLLLLALFMRLTRCLARPLRCWALHSSHEKPGDAHGVSHCGVHCGAPQ